MDPTSCNVPIKVGIINEILNVKGCATKAIVLFKLDGVNQRASLRSKSMVHDGSLLSEDCALDKYVSVGTEIYMRTYPLQEPILQDMCHYIILVAWKRDDLDFPRDPSVQVFHGLRTQPVYFSHHAENFEVGFCKEKRDELIEFHKPDVYILGERYNEELILKTNIEMQCDAIPTSIHPVEGTCWKALVVWRGKRPPVKDSKPFKYNKDDMVGNIKQLTSNPCSIFLRTTGQIVKLLSREYGVALAMIRFNEWHTVLFHTSSCQINDLRIPEAVNLEAIFKPGDKVNILAAKAPTVLNFQWVASNISVYTEARKSQESQLIQIQPGKVGKKNKKK